jgi:hypothetical protein
MIWKSLAALVLGFFGGWFATAAAGLWYMEKAQIFDRDGGGAMGMFFIIGPFGGAIIAIVLAVATLARERARQDRAHAGLPPEPASTGYRVTRGVAAALATYLLAWLAIAISGPWQGDAGTRLLIGDIVPLVLGVGAGAWAFLRRN